MWNLGWDNGYGNSASGLIGNVRCGGTESGSLYADPLFVGPGDDHLRSASPAIDSGTSTNAPGSDFDGRPRPEGAGFDRGAYEVATGSAAQPRGGRQAPPQARDAPAGTSARLRITTKRVRVSRRGTVTLRVACPRREWRYRVRLRLLRGRATIAARTFLVRGGEVRSFTLKLTRCARRALLRARSLEVTAVATMRTRAGRRATTRAAIQLLAPTRK